MPQANISRHFGRKTVPQIIDYTELRLGKKPLPPSLHCTASMFLASTVTGLNTYPSELRIEAFE